MTPYMHALSSSKKHGGKPDDYLVLHDWFDETKAFTGDFTHRALRHHSAGVQWCVEHFGHYLTNSDGKVVPVKLLAEQHVTEDCGYIPTVQDWLSPIKESPSSWMLRVALKSEQVITVKEVAHVS